MECADRGRFFCSAREAMAFQLGRFRLFRKPTFRISGGSMESRRGERADPAGLARFGDAGGELLDRFAGDAARADLVAGV